MSAGRKRKVAIIGPYPPPYGGISVHLERIVTYLPNHSFDLYNIEKRSAYGKKFYGIRRYLYLFAFLFKPYKVIHYHSTSKNTRLFLSIISFFRGNVYLHLHGESFTDAIAKKGFTSRLLKKLIPATNFIASNEQLYKIIEKLDPRSLYLYDAFIPPKFDSETVERFNAAYPPPSTQYSVSLVGWFSSYKNKDLYGFDIALEALQILREKHSLDILFIASINGIADENRYNQFLATRKALNLESEFILYEENLEEVYPLYLNTQVFIRPTNTDGNSVSIKEALWFGTPVVASDCVVRPDEVSLFKNRDAIDLSEKILQLIKSGGLLSSDEKFEYCRSKEFKYSLIEEIYGLDQ